jgi:hypothetical protein
MFLLEAIVVTKFAFVHLLRNPVALNDDFFCFFINVGTAMLSITSQVVYVMMPGVDVNDHEIGHFLPIKKHFYLFIANIIFYENYMALVDKQH